MGSSSGGGNPLKVVEDVVNVATNISSFGTLGFDTNKAGGFSSSKGFATQQVNKFGFDPLKEGLKEITGAKAAEEANAQARKQMDEEKARLDQQRADAKARNAADAIAASRSAGARGSSQGNRNNAFSNYALLGGEQRDFLGL